jgi:hypothetical protein
LELNLPNLGKGVGQEGYVKKTFSPVPLTLLIDFRSFFSSLDDGLGYERIADVLAGVTATSYKSSRVFQRRGAQLLARVAYLYHSPNVSQDISRHCRRRDAPYSQRKCTTESNTSAYHPDIHSALVVTRRAYHLSFD